MDERKDARTRLVKAWVKASEELGFRITAPYSFVCDSGVFECVAYLPDFGSISGIVVDQILPSEYWRTPGLREAVRAQGISYSAINVEVYGSYDAEVFKEALRDWGFFGPESERPEWIWVVLTGLRGSPPENGLASKQIYRQRNWDQVLARCYSEQDRTAGKRKGKKQYLKFIFLSS